MTEEQSPRPEGLQTGTMAPLFDTKDIDGKQVNLKKLLEENNGVLIDFFRGNW